MLYVLRLTSGSCIILSAVDEHSARCKATQVDESAGERIVSLRPLDDLELKLAPTEDGGLEIAAWNDSVLHSILGNEYPLLLEAYQRANAQPFLAWKAGTAVMEHLRTEFERNTEIIREALALETTRLARHERTGAKGKKVGPRCGSRRSGVELPDFLR